MTLFEVIRPGFLTTFQDQGRPGYRQYGLAVSGALDEASHAWGNALLDNDNQACSLEITLGQCQLKTLAPCQIAVTGADLAFTINHQSAPRYQALSLHQGDILHWSQAKQGMRAYLAIASGFQSEIHFGSRSVSLREGVGQPIQAGQILNGIAQTKSINIDRPFPQNALPSLCHANTLVLHMLPSDQFNDFSAASQQAFFQQTFQLSADSNRTGLRLQATQALSTPYANMISEGMLPGSIQIPPDGQPIIMMKEAPTIGGYPKIGTLFTTELNQLAQAMPGQKIRFQAENFIACENRQKRAYRRYYPYQAQKNTLAAISRPASQNVTMPP